MLICRADSSAWPYFTIMEHQPSKYIPALRYSWLTKFYDTFLGITFPEKRIKQALILQCTFRGNEHVLDFGTGTATLSIMIKKQFQGLQVSGIDADEQVLRIAKRKIVKYNLDIGLIHYDGLHIPLPDNAVDKVVSSLVFHHISTENKKTVLKEIFRIIRPGSEIHIADFGKATNLYQKIAFGIFRRMDGEENTSINSKGLLPEFLKEAGFTNVVETQYFNTLFGTIKLISATKNE